MWSFKNEEMFPPESIPDAIPPTERALKYILEASPDDIEVLFALGCLHLRAQDARLAAPYFKDVLKREPHSAKTLCNLAICCMLEGKERKAETLLKKAILARPDLWLLHFHIALIKGKRGATQAAISSLKKVIGLHEKHAASFLLLGKLCESSKRKNIQAEAAGYYEKAFLLDASLEEARNRLGALAFERGRLLFEDGNLDEAFAVWGAAYKEYERAFSADQSIAKSMYDLVQAFAKTHTADADLSRYTNELAALLAPKEDQAPASEAEIQAVCYPLFCRFYFSIGKFPELYVPQSELDAAIARWEQGMNDEVILPFHHFQRAVVLSYQGRLEDAISDLSIARDHLPESKQRPLKLEAISKFLKELFGHYETEEGVRISAASEDEWEAQGFGDPFQLRAWKKTGLEPEQAAAWRAEEFSASEALAWKRKEISLEDALLWRSHGFTKALEVLRWKRAEFVPEEAAAWSEAFEGDLEAAIQSRQAGFSEPLEAKRWLGVFMFPSEAIRWKELGFSSKDAALWLAQGVKEPFDALQQKQAEQRLAEEVESSEEKS